MCTNLAVRGGEIQLEGGKAEWKKYLESWNGILQGVKTQQHWS